MTGFNPEVFKWARESAGLDVVDAANALAIKKDSLGSVEAGDEDPSRALLLRMSKVYRRSLLTLYLSKPPEKGDRGEDFRTLPAEQNSSAAAEIDVLLRDVRSRQGMVRSILEDDEDHRAHTFVGSLSLSDGPADVATAIIKTLKIERGEFRKQRNSEQAFAYLRKKVEDVGIFVLLIGNLGSHHSTIPIEVFRGFAIADKLAPFVVINDGDAKSAWSFTLLHEIAHLWIGASGVSGGGKLDHRVEQFCNEVAASILIDPSEISNISVRGLSIEEQISVLSDRAKLWKVSRRMLAYGLLKAGLINQQNWIVLDRSIHSLWLSERSNAKDSQKKRSGGPSYYVLRRHRVGSAMLDFVSRSLDAGTLTPVKAAHVLGVKPRAVYPLLHGA